MDMQAIIAEHAGGPEVLTLVERPVPTPGTGEVLIHVAAAGVNRPDVLQRSGALPAPADVSDILGLEVSGEIVAAGSGVDSALIGTRVMALVKAGGYASHVLARADHCLPVPDGLDMLQAAVLPEGLFTIWHNLFDRGALKPGQTVLIQGGASGIGTLALQLARAWGAEVIVTAGGAAKCARLQKMGATAIDYHSADLVAEVLRLTQGRGVDVVLDILGGDMVSKHLACMAPGGRHIGLSFMTGMIAPVDLGLVMRKGLWLSSSTLRPKSCAEKAAIAAEVRAHLLPLIGPGMVAPVISQVFALADAAQAHALLESGGNFGKIVLSAGGASGMRLYWGPASPFVRKVMVTAHELGLQDKIQLLDSAAHPVDRDRRIQAFHPLAKVPAAMTDDGTALYDSRVICEYLDAAAGGGLFPAPGPARWTALRRQALADGLLDAALLIRYEHLARPLELQWSDWIDRQGEKVTDALDAMQADPPQDGVCDIGAISVGCALGWLDFRFPDLNWRDGRPALAAWQAAFDARPAMIATRPAA